MDDDSDSEHEDGHKHPAYREDLGKLVIAGREQKKVRVVAAAWGTFTLNLLLEASGKNLRKHVSKIRPSHRPRLYCVCRLVDRPKIGKVAVVAEKVSDAKELFEKSTSPFRKKARAKQRRAGKAIEMRRNSVDIEDLSRDTTSLRGISLKASVPKAVVHQRRRDSLVGKRGASHSKIE
jgi:hypothetical protein